MNASMFSEVSVAFNHDGSGKSNAQATQCKPPSSANLHHFCQSFSSSDYHLQHSFQSPPSIPQDFRFSLVNVFLLPVPFSYTVPSHYTAAASLRPKCTTWEKKKNLTFLGFCKITPSTISLVILRYRQTEEYSNTSKATLTWTVNRQIMHLICTLNNSSHQRLLNSPT